MKMWGEKEHLLWQNRAQRENPGARVSMLRLDSRAWREVVVVGTKKWTW
jgi:hypothetical protein